MVATSSALSVVVLALSAAVEVSARHRHNSGVAFGGNFPGSGNGPSNSNSSPGPRQMRQRHSRTKPPAAFSKSESKGLLKLENESIALRIHLTKNDRAGLEQRLLESSTPSHPNYGKHLSREEVDAYVRPTEQSTAAVNAWLAEHNLTATSVTSAGDVLSISLPVGSANTLLAASYDRYQHASGTSAIRTMGYSLPVDLDDHVLLVEPTTDFMDPQFADPRQFSTRSSANLTAFMEHFVAPGHQARLHSKSKRLDDFCADWMTPQCLQDLYGIPNAGGFGYGTLAVTGFIRQYANEADLSQFLAHLRPDMNNQTKFETQFVEGGQNPQDASQAGTEASLDVQFSVGVAGHAIPVTFVSVGDAGSNGNGFLDVITDWLNRDNLPQVISTSYGMQEADLGPDLVRQLCDQYMQIGARGVSLLFSSGDSGVGSGDCQAFAPTFPSGCPYITSVGATDGYSPEKAATFSTGGFSNVFDQPTYQSSSVAGFLSNSAGKHSGLYNAKGRAFPDISAAGTNFPVVTNTAWNPVGGTSASTPVIASIIALLNDELLSKGKAPLGFLNPWLYANVDSFTDVTAGNNPGCGTDGFDALHGWDPVTGLGTPIYSKLRAAAGLA